jgi:glycosyl transferase family 25
MLPVFVINLDRSPERLAEFSRRCGDAGISFERFRGIDGTDLPDRLKPYFCDSAGKIVSPLKPAEIGCYASHIGMWQRIVDLGIPAAVVCEDDAMLPDGFAGILDGIVSELPASWDMVLLANPTRAACRPIGRSLIRYSRIPGGLGCYLMSRSGAFKMLHPVTPRMWASDHDSRWPWRFGMDTYGVNPAPVSRRPAISTINPSGRGRSRLRAGWRWPPHRTPQSFLFNLRKLGPYWWLRCALVNTAAKIGKLAVPMKQWALAAPLR